MGNERTPGMWKVRRLKEWDRVVDNSIWTIGGEWIDTGSAANAAFIVQAANAHDALVTASEALVAYLDDMYSIRGKWIEGDTPDDRQLLTAGKLAKAAIALATEATGG